MQRRTALKAAGASLLTGTVLSTSVAADDGPKIVSVETEPVDNTDGNNEYTVEYLGNGKVKITGYAIAPTPCHEVSVENVVHSRYGDIVELALVSGDGICADVISGVTYTVKLVYSDEASVADIFVNPPDGAST